MVPNANKAQNSNGFLKFMKMRHEATVIIIIEIFSQNFLWIVTIVMNIEITMPIIGASKIKSSVRLIPPLSDQFMLLKPECAIAAPAKPPIKVWEDEEGMPYHHVRRFQQIAAITPASTTTRS